MNMRLLSSHNKKKFEQLRLFSQWILTAGDGNINNANDRIVDIDIPDDILLKQCDDPILTIVKEVYDGKFGGRSNKDFSKQGNFLFYK